MKKGILASLMAVSIRLDVLAMRYGLTMDASYPKDPDPKNWRTINHSKVHLSGGKIDGGAGGKFHGKAWTGKVPHEFTPKGEATQGLNGAGGNDKINTEEEALKKVIQLKNRLARLRAERQKAGNEKYDYYREKIAETKDQIINAKVEAAKHGVIFASGLEKSLDKQDVREIKERIKNAPEHVRMAWNRYEENMKVAETDAPNQFYCNGAVHINIWKERHTDGYGRPAYCVTFHEIGHLIDDYGGHNRASGSAKYQLLDSLKSEVNEHVAKTFDRLKAEAIARGESPRTVKKAEAYKAIKKELEDIGVSRIAGVSDVFSGITKNKVKDGGYHPTAYWKEEETKVCTEFFAETFSQSVCNQKALEMTKRYFPKSFDIFSRTLKDVARGERL